jgi:uncharacterized protein (TIGR02453 family)
MLKKKSFLSTFKSLLQDKLLFCFKNKKQFVFLKKTRTMSKINSSTFQFLKELKENNDRDWFNANKPRYQEARQNFIDFVGELLLQIAEFDPSISHHEAKNCVFRIYRDVRFSKDKSPYKTNFGAHVTSAAKKSEIHSRAGYYIHLEPGGSFLAGGAYMPQGPWLKAIRQEIAYNADDLKKILNSKSFKQYFGAMEGEKLKTSPRDYPKDHPEIELLRHKSFLATHHCDDPSVLSEDFVVHCGQVFKALHPFDAFLNRAMD